MSRTSKSRWRVWVVVVLAVLFSLVLLVLAPALFFRAMGLAGMVLMVLSVAAMVITCRRARRVTAMSQVIPAVVSVVTVLLFAGLAGGPVGGGTAFACAMLGVLAGGGWGLMGKFSARGGQVRLGGTPWHLVIWGGVFAVSQCLAVVGGRGPAIMMSLLFLSMGLVLGRSGVTLARYFRFRSVAGNAPPVLS